MNKVRYYDPWEGEVLAALHQAVKKADKVYLTHYLNDREEKPSHGIYITHLKLENKTTVRITFNGILKTAVKDSIKHKGIDMNLVDAQQAKTCSGPNHGIQISPILWAKRSNEG